MKTQIIDILKSWKTEESTVNSTEELIKWIQNLNETTHVRIEETRITDDTFWFYDDYEGEILNRKRSFFQLKEYASLLTESSIVSSLLLYSRR